MESRYDSMTKMRKMRLINTSRRSITSDNGTEFAGLAEFRKVVGCLVYRCHPYASRENGIIR
ncbi:MAG: hypothetical protein LBP53_05610 [Candidatus Peribacteria bacterium]|nr:hypothetical protein [Candidatus Peribacteria bacterium]